MPRFTPDFNAAQAGFPIYDAGLYRIEITDVEPISREGEVYVNRKPTGRTELKVGANLKAKIVGGDFDGKPVSSNVLWVHNEKGWGITKRAIMAILGYTVEQEDAARAEFDNPEDWAIDAEGEDVSLGAGWQRLVGNQVMAVLSVREFQDTKTNQMRRAQNFDNYLPVMDSVAGERRR